MNYYLHHIGDYDADTAHLSWVEDMAYARLLRLYYRRESPIPADPAEACRLIRAQTKDQKQAVETVLREFFILTDDGWRQARCDAEIEDYQVKVAHNRRVGKLGGRPRKIKTQMEPEHNPPGFSEENPPGSFWKPKQNPPHTPYPIHKKSALRAPKEKVSFAKPDAIDMQAWADWQAVRKAKHAGAVTATAFAGLQREADKAGLSAGEAVRICAERGWQGFRADWHANGHAARNGSGPAPEPAWRTEQRERTAKAAPYAVVRSTRKTDEENDVRSLARPAA